MSENRSRVLRGCLYAGLGGVCWGFSGTCGQYLFAHFEVDTLWLTCVRLLGGGGLLTALALVLGLVLGVIVSLVRVSWDNTHTELQPGIGKFFLGLGNAICKVYLTVIRGTPVVVQIMIIFFVIMASSNNKILAGVVAFGINSGAYVAEIVRGGIMSIDRGQMEAGRSMGFGYVPTMRYMALRQGVMDVKYLAKLKEAGKNSPEAQAFLKNAAKRGVDDFNYDSSMPDKVREEAAHLILKLQKEGKK